MTETYPGSLNQLYDINEKAEPADILKEIGTVRKCIKKGGEVDYEKTAALLLDDFRNTRLGTISLEFPSER